MIISTSAFCGSGQDSLADQICNNFDFIKVSSGDYLRNIAKLGGLSPNRENLYKIRKDLALKYDEIQLVKLMLGDLPENTIITGIRTLVEYDYLKRTHDTYHVFFTADYSIRLSRLLKRGTAKDPKSKHEFQKQMERELELYDLDELKEKADFIFEFNEPYEEFISNPLDFISRLPIYSKLL